MFGRQLAAVALLLASLMGATDEIVADSGSFDPTRVRWSQLDFRASKLAVTATSEVEIRTEPASLAAIRWLESSKGRPVTPEVSEVVRIQLRSVVLGKSSDLDLWIDPLSGAAIQRTQLETGKKVRHNRHRSLRFTDTGVFNSTFRATEETMDRPFEEWAVSEAFETFPVSLTPGVVVTEPSALFYLLATAHLDEKGDAILIHVFSKKRVMRVRLAVLGSTEIRVDYTETADAGQRQIKGRQEVVRIRLESSPVGSDGSDRSFEFLGLRGDVEIFLEPARRIPLQISGNIRYVGKGHVRLQRVRLK